MSIVRCFYCDTYIDTDLEVERVADWEDSICVDCVSDSNGDCIKCGSPKGIFDETCPCCDVRKEG
jgi:hypothetical protein